MGLEEVYDFLYDNIQKYVDSFFNQIPQKMYTIGQFEKMVKEYNISQIIKDYECYLRECNIDEPIANYDETLVIGSTFYTACMNRFNGEESEWDS